MAADPVQFSISLDFIWKRFAKVYPMIRGNIGSFVVVFLIIAFVGGGIAWWAASNHFGVLITERDIAIADKDKEINRLSPANYNNLLKDQTTDLVESIQDIITSVENRNKPEDNNPGNDIVSGATMTNPIRTVYFIPKEIQRWDRLKTRALTQREKLLARLPADQRHKHKDSEKFYLAPLNLNVLHAVVDDLTLLKGRL